MLNSKNRSGAKSSHFVVPAPCGPIIDAGLELLAGDQPLRNTLAERSGHTTCNLRILCIPVLLSPQPVTPIRCEGSATIRSTQYTPLPALQVMQPR
jgi:hypothetical protein